VKERIPTNPYGLYELGYLCATMKCYKMMQKLIFKQNIKNFS